MKRFSDRSKLDAFALTVFWAIWCSAAFAIGFYFIAYGTLLNALETPVARYAWFAIPALVGIVALASNPLLQFRRNSEAQCIVSRARDGRRCDADFFLYLRPFTSDGRIRAEGMWLIDNPLALIGRRMDLEGALTSQLASTLGLLGSQSPPSGVDERPQGTIWAQMGGGDSGAQKSGEFPLFRQYSSRPLSRTSSTKRGSARTAAIS